MPPGCEITYTCVGVSGPDLDVQCDIPGVTTFDGVYDGQNTDGTWTFGTDLIKTYGPGDYVITIEGVTGIDSFQTT